MMMNNQSH